VQLALIRHPGVVLAQMDDPVDGLVAWLAVQLSGDFLWDRAAATAEKRRPLNLGRLRIAA
jgi:P2-related tail formation protein